MRRFLRSRRPRKATARERERLPTLAPVPEAPRRGLRWSDVRRIAAVFLVGAVLAVSLAATLTGWVHLAADVLGPRWDGILHFEYAFAEHVTLGFAFPGVFGPVLSTLVVIWTPRTFWRSDVLRRAMVVFAASSWIFPTVAMAQSILLTPEWG